MNKQLEERLMSNLPRGSAQRDSFLLKAESDINGHVVASTGVTLREALMGYVGQSAMKRHVETDGIQWTIRGAANGRAGGDR